MASSSSSTKVTMKLLIDTKNQKVLFAEASKPVVDFLFNLLCLPVGTVVRLLTKDDMVGSFGNLYKSVEILNGNYMEPNQGKDVMLKPKAHISSTEIAGLLPANDADAKNNVEHSLFMCPDRCGYIVTFDNTTYCPNHGSLGGRYSTMNVTRTMNVPVKYVGNKVAVNQETTSIKGGFVKEIVPFMVMDDLVVEPMSISSINALLNNINVKDLGALQEKVVQLGMAEGIKLLKASLQSKAVLTSVFINKNSE